MSGFLSLFGFHRSSVPRRPQGREFLHVEQPLRRILAFTGRSIDDVVNCPIAKREVLGYYKLHKWIHRQAEIGELERQWNP